MTFHFQAERKSSNLIVYKLSEKRDNLHKCSYIESLLMSSNLLTLPTEISFRNANGEQLTLEEKGSSSIDGIINFVLRSKKRFNVNLHLALLCTIFLIWTVSETLTAFIISVCVLILQCKSFIAATKQGKFEFLYNRCLMEDGS